VDPLGGNARIDLLMSALRFVALEAMILKDFGLG
jgi:hypothetical protein